MSLTANIASLAVGLFVLSGLATANHWGYMAESLAVAWLVEIPILYLFTYRFWGPTAQGRQSFARRVLAVGLGVNFVTVVALDLFVIRH